MKARLLDLSLNLVAEIVVDSQPGNDPGVLICQDTRCTPCVRVFARSNAFFMPGEPREYVERDIAWISHPAHGTVTHLPNG